MDLILESLIFVWDSALDVAATAGVRVHLHRSKGDSAIVVASRFVLVECVQCR